MFFITQNAKENKNSLDFLTWVNPVWVTQNLRGSGWVSSPLISMRFKKYFTR